MAACSCTGDTSPFGYSNCVSIAQRAVGFGFELLKDDTGLVNSIVAPVSQSDWESFLYSNDEGLRINLLKNVKTVVDERADPETEELDGISYITAEGQRYISFEVIGAPNKLKSYVDGLNCKDGGFYMVSAGNEIVGRLEDGELFPIPYEKGTLYTKIIPATRTTQQKLMVKFMVAESFDDADMGFIPADQITADLKATTPQISVGFATAPAVASATTITCALEYNLNNSSVSQPYVGAETTDFDLYNVTTSASVPVTPSEPVTDGTYVLTFAAQTTSDVLELRDRDGSPISFTTVTGLVAL